MKKVKNMTLKTIIKRIEKEYKYALSVKEIYKPMSYALYRVWRWCDTYEKERTHE